MQRARFRVVVLLIFSAAFLTGCPAHTNYRGAQRLTDHTAYTLEPGEVLMGAGVVGSNFDNLLASVRLEWNPYVPGLEVGTNLAHDALSFVNVYAKYNLVDTRWFGLGLRLGFKWLDGNRLWALPESTALHDEIGGAEMFMVPFSTHLSLPLADWFALHTELSYMYTPVSGDLVLDGSHYKAGITWHEVTINPALHFYAPRGVAFLVGVQLPVYSAVSGEGYQETPLPNHDGVRYGLLASVDTAFDVSTLVSPWLGMHVAWKHFNLRATLTWGLRFFNRSTFQEDGWLAYAPLPGLEMFWRF